MEGSEAANEASHIVFERLGFCTRAMNVRYNDEMFTLNDGAFFRAEKVTDVVLYLILQYLRACVCLLVARSGSLTHWWRGRHGCSCFPADADARRAAGTGGTGQWVCG